MLPKCQSRRLELFANNVSAKLQKSLTEEKNWCRDKMDILLAGSPPLLCMAHTAMERDGKAEESAWSLGADLHSAAEA